MRHAFISFVTISFLVSMGCLEAQALPRPAWSLTQKAGGLTQNNTSGLSQNLYGRTSTATATNSGVQYPGINRPSLPQPAVAMKPMLTPGAPVQATAAQPTVSPEKVTPPANNNSQVQGSQSAPAQSPTVAPLDGAVPEAPSNE